MKFIPNPHGSNEVLEADGFMVSYNSGREPNVFNGILVAMGGMKPENVGRPETALCIPDDNARFGRRHFILYGDWREAYAAIAHQGFGACMALFHKNIEHITDTSDVPKVALQ
jgi:hypothetical protein